MLTTPALRTYVAAQLPDALVLVARGGGTVTVETDDRGFALAKIAATVADPRDVRRVNVVRATTRPTGGTSKPPAPVSTVIHRRDSDCTVDPATECCTVCGVAHGGGACATCGGRGFHQPPCADTCGGYCNGTCTAGV